MAKEHEGHELDGIVSAAKKDPRFAKMKGGKSDADGDYDGDEDGVCPKCGHRDGHE